METKKIIVYHIIDKLSVPKIRLPKTDKVYEIQTMYETVMKIKDIVTNKEYKDEEYKLFTYELHSVDIEGVEEKAIYCDGTIEDLKESVVYMIKLNREKERELKKASILETKETELSQVIFNDNLDRVMSSLIPDKKFNIEDSNNLYDYIKGYLKSRDSLGIIYKVEEFSLRFPSGEKVYEGRENLTALKNKLTNVKIHEDDCVDDSTIFIKHYASWFSPLYKFYTSQGYKIILHKDLTIEVQSIIAKESALDEF